MRIAIRGSTLNSVPECIDSVGTDLRIPAKNFIVIMRDRNGYNKIIP
jgi:hypothetical protein